MYKRQVFERHKALFAPQVRIVEILGDLAEPDAHAALAAEAAEGVHRAEKRLARQLLGDALAPGKREKIAVHIVKVHGVDPVSYTHLDVYKRQV